MFQPTSGSHSCTINDFDRVLMEEDYKQPSTQPFWNLQNLLLFPLAIFHIIWRFFSLRCLFFGKYLFVFFKQRILFNRCIKRLHVMGFHVSQNETHFCRFFRMKWKQMNVWKWLKNRPILEKYLHWAIFFYKKKNVGCLFLAKRN